MGGSGSIGGGSSQLDFEFELGKQSGFTGAPIAKAKGETGQNVQTSIDLLGNIDRVKSKLDKNTGIDALEQIPAIFDLETTLLNERRNEILGRISDLDREASKSVAQARITKRRQTGRSSTIL
jgi:hypothetical protein